MATMQRTVVEQLSEEYRAGKISRRELFQKAAYALGSILLAQQFMLEYGFASEWEAYNWPDAQDQPPPTPAESIKAGEARLPANVQAEWVKYAGGAGEVGGYLARPKTGTSFAAIIVIHENRGLTEFVLDMAQRWAAEGMLAVAPDFLSPVGGTAKFATMQEAGQGIGQLNRDGVMADLAGTVKFLQGRKEVKKDKIGVSGFCWGGGNTWAFATRSKEIAFAMPFYGGAPPLDQLANISCPMFAVYAEQDTRINANMEEVTAKMAELGKNYAKKVYPGAQHAFMNFTSPQRYNAEQAKIAWADVTAFVKKTIG